MSTCILIPVYNNTNTIAEVVTRCLKAAQIEIIVVADGSTDGSDEKAEAAGARVVRLAENQGKGCAIMCGLQEAQKRGYKNAIVLDADGQHHPEEIPLFLEAVSRRPDSIWVGVRNMPSGEAPTISRRGRSISNFWTTLNGWQRVQDAQCGFRAYPIDNTLALGCRSPRFEFEMEVLVRASWAGLKIMHLNIEVTYPRPGEAHLSHFDKKRDNLRATWLCFSMFWQMLIRSPILLYKRALRARTGSI